MLGVKDRNEILHYIIDYGLHVYYFLMFTVKHFIFKNISIRSVHFWVFSILCPTFKVRARQVSFKFQVHISYVFPLCVVTDFSCRWSVLLWAVRRCCRQLLQSGQWPPGLPQPSLQPQLYPARRSYHRLGTHTHTHTSMPHIHVRYNDVC